jgi:hypothetical protein
MRGDVEFVCRSLLRVLGLAITLTLSTRPSTQATVMRGIQVSASGPRLPFTGIATMSLHTAKAKVALHRERQVVCPQPTNP